MSGWFWVALGMLPFALIGLWFVVFVMRNASMVRSLKKASTR